MSDSANPPQGTVNTNPVESQSSQDQNVKSRSRSASRRARRQKQSNKQQQQLSSDKASKMGPLQERDGDQTEEMEPQAEAGAMRPFEHIGPDSTSMDGPVTYARAQRGEIPLRPGNPNPALATGNTHAANPENTLMRQQQEILDNQKDGGSGKSDLMDQDGLKLRIDLNLDLEIELKAKLRGDITIALLA